MDKIKEILDKIGDDFAAFIGGFDDQAGGILGTILGFFKTILGVITKDTAPEEGEGE